MIFILMRVGCRRIDIYNYVYIRVHTSVDMITITFPASPGNYNIVLQLRLESRFQNIMFIYLFISSSKSRLLFFPRIPNKVYVGIEGINKRRNNCMWVLQ